MAYRRRQSGVPKDLTFATRNDEIGSPNINSPPPDDTSSSSSSASSASSLAAKAIRASSAHRDSSLSSAYVQSAHSPRDSKSNPLRSPRPPSTKDSPKYGYTSMPILDEPKHGFWGVLARKAKSIIDDDNVSEHRETPERRRLQMSDKETRSEYNTQYQSPEIRRKAESPRLQKGLDAITSSINYIGGTIGNALEEGITIVENRTADIIQETKKLQIRKKGINTPETQTSAFTPTGTRQPPENLAFSIGDTRQHPQMQTNSQLQTQTDFEIQLKASRDVAMAMAAKAKLLLRELKTVKADLAFAKERCAQLEEENRILRESGGDGDNQEDDDLIRLQLETLLAEKARLAQENSVFARENRFLREIVEYHQLTMQDVVYLDESSEEVTEVYPIRVSSSTSNLQSLSITQTLHIPPSFTLSPSPSPSTPRDTHTQPSEFVEDSQGLKPSPQETHKYKS